MRSKTIKAAGSIALSLRFAYFQLYGPTEKYFDKSWQGSY